MFPPISALGKNLWLIILVAVALIGLGFTTPSASSFSQNQSSPQPQQQKMERKPGGLVILRHDDVYNPYRVAPPRQAELGVQTANIVVNYNPLGCSGNISPWPAQAQIAFNTAVGIWESLLVSDQPIVISACWRSDLGQNVLGSAGPTDFFRNFANAPASGTWYPIGLANSLAGFDLNDNDNFDTDRDGRDLDPEINANFSSTFDWYFGVNANPPATQVDFVSVVLHELGHGLGFVGSGIVLGDIGIIGTLNSPVIYDRFTETGSGAPLLNFPNGSASLGNALKGNANGLFFDGAHANEANNGNRVELFAPGIWIQGSSYSHLAESFNNTPNALMTFSLADGEALHNPGPVTLGLFQDLGWRAAVGPDLKVVNRVTRMDYQPGDPVTFTLTIENIGSETASDIVVTDMLPTEILTPDFDSDISDLSVRSGTPYTWDLEELEPSESGTISVFGVISPDLSADFAIINTVTVETSADEADTSNNTSTAIVGGEGVYLPMLIKL